MLRVPLPTMGSLNPYHNRKRLQLPIKVLPCLSMDGWVSTPHPCCGSCRSHRLYSTLVLHAHSGSVGFLKVLSPSCHLKVRKLRHEGVRNFLTQHTDLSLGPWL